MTAFEVRGERPAGSRFEARRSGRPSPMVGRDQELALVLERWRQAVTGEGQAVLLVGEAGIGKSRLVRAVLDAVAGGEHATLRYQCSPHHTGTALWPVARQLGFAAGFEPGDTDTLRLDKLEALLRRGVDDVREAAPLVADLLGIDAGARHAVPDLSPRHRRTRTLAVLADQLLGLARRRPVLMVLEDAHWIDPTTLELVGQALDRIAGARALMLLTTRPDNQPTLGGHPHVTRLTLNRLGRGPTEAIVGFMAGGRSLPPEVLGAIAARTDGVPLFVEELTKAVLEAGPAGPAGAAAVPASLHASLMARLDRVPGVKEAAQVAACIGREFAYPLLAMVSDLPEAELRPALDRLAAAELVFGRGEPPEASYSFKHALVRDAAHESLLKSQRQLLHARIAQALEECFPETAEAEPELLAQHCAEAGLAREAIGYRLRAGLRAIDRAASTESLAQLRHGLALVDAVPDEATRFRLELDLQIACGSALVLVWATSSSGIDEIYARARELCERLDARSDLFKVLYGQCIVRITRGEAAATLGAAEDLMRQAEALGDVDGLVVANRLLGVGRYYTGRFAQARESFERSLALVTRERRRSTTRLYVYDPKAASAVNLARCLHVLGRIGEALREARRAVAEAEGLGHPPTLAFVLHLVAFVFMMRRDAAAVRAHAKRVSALCAEYGIGLWGIHAAACNGWALFETGQREAEIGELREALDKGNGFMEAPRFLAALAEMYGREGQAADGLDRIGLAIDAIERNGEHWIEPEVYRIKGEPLQSLGAAREAEACFARALGMAREQGAKLWELRAARSLARLWRDQGRGTVGRSLLAPVCGWFTEGFDTPDLQEAKALLDELG